MNKNLLTAFAWGAKIILAGTFITAGVLKLADLPTAQMAVSGYRMLPDILLWPATLLLPWFEIISGVALFLPQMRRAATGCIGLMLLAFLIAILSAWGRGIDLECGCFGGTGKSNYPWLVIRDLGLIALLFLARGRKTPKQPPMNEAPPQAAPSVS